MTDEEWIAARLAEAPKMSAACRNELALLLRDKELALSGPVESYCPQYDR
jgi:hypothetical protein